MCRPTEEKKVERDSEVISMGMLNIRELNQIIQKKMGESLFKF